MIVSYYSPLFFLEQIHFSFKISSSGELRKLKVEDSSLDKGGEGVYFGIPDFFVSLFTRDVSF